VELKAETLSSSCSIGDGKGGFQREELPQPLQLAPIFSFTSFKYEGENKFLGAGNFYGVLPYEGRYDALLPTIFSYNKNNSVFNAHTDYEFLNGEVRNERWLHTSQYGDVLLVARNNEALTFFKFNNRN
jgi:hypothetical protein